MGWVTYEASAFRLWQCCGASKGARPPRNGHAQPDWLSESGEEFRRQLEQPKRRAETVEHNGWAECLQNAGNAHAT